MRRIAADAAGAHATVSAMGHDEPDPHCGAAAVRHVVIDVPRLKARSAIR
jgi:hypothetical protein